MSNDTNNNLCPNCSKQTGSSAVFCSGCRTPYYQNCAHRTYALQNGAYKKFCAASPPTSIVSSGFGSVSNLNTDNMIPSASQSTVPPASPGSKEIIELAFSQHLKIMSDMMANLSATLFTKLDALSLRMDSAEKELADLSTRVSVVEGTERDSNDQIVKCPKSTIHILLSCRTVRIGSYKYSPIKNVILSEYGLRLNVPFIKDHRKLVTVDVKFKQIVRLLVHCGKSMPVFFFYATTGTGEMIRDVLGMQDPKGSYYDPASRDHTHKRIILFPDKISEEARMLLKSLYVGKLEEINSKETNDILVRALTKDV